MKAPSNSTNSNNHLIVSQLLELLKVFELLNYWNCWQYWNYRNYWTIGIVDIIGIIGTIELSKLLKLLNYWDCWQYWNYRNPWTIDIIEILELLELSELSNWLELGTSQKFIVGMNSSVRYGRGSDKAHVHFARTWSRFCCADGTEWCFTQKRNCNIGIRDRRDEEFSVPSCPAKKPRRPVPSRIPHKFFFCPVLSCVPQE